MYGKNSEDSFDLVVMFLFRVGMDLYIYIFTIR